MMKPIKDKDCPYSGIDKKVKEDMIFKSYQKEIEEKMENASTDDERRYWGSRLVWSALEDPKRFR
jgi:hypothetical protein